MKNKYLKTFITNPVAHLSGAVEHGDLGGEVGHTGGGLVLGVGGDVDALNIVAGDSLGKGFVVHLHGLHLDGELDGREGDDHARLDDAGLHTAHGQGQP